MKTELKYYREGYQKAKFEVEEGSPSRDFLLLIFGGSFWIRLPELDKEYLIEAGEGIFLPVGMRFERKILSPIDYHQFAFCCEESDERYQALRGGRLRIPPSHLNALMESLHRANLQGAGEETVVCLLEHLFVEEALYAKEPEGRFEMTEDIRDTIQYMNAHLEEKLDMRALASRVYLSHTGLIWKFRRQLGVTPLQYLISLRMQLARRLLLEEDLPIGEIAERCGYPSAYYFTNAFHKSTGKSPSAFRARREKEIDTLHFL